MTNKLLYAWRNAAVREKKNGLNVFISVWCEVSTQNLELLHVHSHAFAYWGANGFGVLKATTDKLLSMGMSESESERERETMGPRMQILMVVKSMCRHCCCWCLLSLLPFSFAHAYFTLKLHTKTHHVTHCD